MITQDSKEALMTGAKVVGVWGLLGAYSIAEFASLMAAFASMAAAILTTLFICEFLWKKMIRPFLEWKGLLAPKRDRRRYDRRLERRGRPHLAEETGPGELN